MSDIKQLHCQPPEGLSGPMPRAECEATLKQLAADWTLDPQAGWISRRLKFANFHETMSFVNAVAWIANREDHHPDMEVSYSHCVVRFSTHAVGGLSINDFICAARVDALFD